MKFLQLLKVKIPSWLVVVMESNLFLLRFSYNFFTTNYAWNFFLDFSMAKDMILKQDVLEKEESTVHEWDGFWKWIFLL